MATTAGFEPATSCSAYKGRLVKNSSLKNTPFMIAHFIPDRVCSFTEAEHCSNDRKIGVFYQIELFDNTLILVPELHIRTVEFLHKDDYYCFDYQGNELEDRSRTTKRSGTAAFCRRHPCVEPEEANTFCTYSSEVTTYEANKTSIIIKAWGTTTRTYYHHKELLPNATTPHFTIPQCATGGLQIDTTEKFEMVEICSAHVCIYISDYEPKSRILLPTSIVLFDYATSIQAWTNGTRQFHATLKCKGKPICEVLECTICWEHVYNWQCWTTTEIVTATAASLLMLVFCRLLSPFFVCLWWITTRLLRLPKKIITSIIQRSHRRKYTLPQFPSYSKKRTHKFSRTLPLTLALAMLLQPAQPCSDVVSVTSTSSNCEFDGTTETCIVDQAVTLHLQPIGQESCLLLRDSNNQPAGTISLRLHNVVYQCQQKTQYYTRDHSFHTELNHQCWNTHSCRGETCKGTKTSSKIPELSRNANQRPGFTYCSPSCKCIWCDWCFRCRETCIFYRNYAEPESSIIYRVFSCPSWPLKAHGTISINTPQEQEYHDFVLQPAIPYRWNQIQLALTATTTPNFPILSSFFITNGEKVTAIDPSPAGLLLPQSVGQLQCSTLKDAQEFNTCKYSQSACKCTTTVYDASCECPSGNIKTIFKNNSRTLPLASDNIILLKDENELIAKTSSGTSISIQMTISHLQIYTKRSRNTCAVKAGTLNGCYSCYKGATVDISCTSSLTEETSEIICDNQTQLAICKPEGHVTTLTFHFQKATIDTNCSVKCPAGGSSFSLRGELNFVIEPRLHNDISKAKHTQSEGTGFVSFFHGIRESISSNISNLWTTLTNWKTIILLALFVPLITHVIRSLRKRKAKSVLIKKTR